MRHSLHNILRWPVHAPGLIRDRRAERAGAEARTLGENHLGRSYMPFFWPIFQGLLFRQWRKIRLRAPSCRRGGRRTSCPVSWPPCAVDRSGYRRIDASMTLVPVIKLSRPSPWHCAATVREARCQPALACRPSCWSYSRSRGRV